MLKLLNAKNTNLSHRKNKTDIFDKKTEKCRFTIYAKCPQYSREESVGLIKK